MNRLQMFEYFYNYFINNPTDTYYSFLIYITKNCGYYDKNGKITVDKIRRNLQKMNVLKCEKHMLGKGKIYTTKMFNEEKVNNYRKYLLEKGNK